MPVKSVHALIGVLCMAAWPGAGSAQSLPHRANAESTLGAGIHKALWRDRHVVTVEPDAPALLAFDANGGLIDLDLVHGPLPEVLASPGGALFLDTDLQRLDDMHWLVDSGVQGAGWLLLDAGRTAAGKAVVQVRNEGRRGHEDPWQVPLPPAGDPAVARRRPGHRDHVVALAATAPRTFRAGAAQQVRIDLWRAQMPLPLPPDASWLRIQADGQVIFDARVPPASERERLSTTDGCAQVLDLAGRLQLTLPPRTRELRVWGEAGAWIRVLAPLPGTPQRALAPAADPAQQRLLRRPGESLQAAFNRALSWFPDPRAQRYLARHSYYRPTMVSVVGGNALHSRSWRARYPQQQARPTAASNPALAGTETVGATRFHWLLPGASLTIGLPAEEQLALLRVSVAHPAPGAPAVELRMTQAGARPRRLRLDPQAQAALLSAPADTDGLLALQPGGEDIVDASAVTLRVVDVREPMTLRNQGEHGAWIAVEQRTPAPVRLSTDAVQVVAAATPQRLRSALLDTPPSSEQPDAYDILGDTRAIARTRGLLQSRARAFRGDRCFIALRDPSPQQAQAALRLLQDVEQQDPVLARCALWQAASFDPDAEPVARALDRWARLNRRTDVRTGFVAWRLLRADGRADPALWLLLADALRAEDELEPAALARLAADATPTPVEPVLADEQVPAQSAGLTRLQSDRDVQLSYWSGAPTQALEWNLRAGDYALELRSAAQVPAAQWVDLGSGSERWSSVLPAADASDEATTRLRDLRSGLPPGAAVRLNLHAEEGAVLRVQARDAALLGRLQSFSPMHPSQPGANARTPVRIDVAAQCGVTTLRTQLPVVQSHAPVEGMQPVDGASIAFAAAAPVIEQRPVGTRDVVAGRVRNEAPVQAALDALWLLAHGRPDEGLAAAGWALHRRQQVRAIERGAPADTGTDDASGVFALLEAQLRWRTMDAVVASAGKRMRPMADGHPGSPLLARRDALAGGPTDETLVLRPGQNWKLEGLLPRQRVRLHLRHYSPLPHAGLALTLTNGAAVSLSSGQATVVVDVADTSGRLRLRLGDALPGSVVGLQVQTADGEPIDARLPRVYHRATAATPLRLRIDRPGYLRIVEWDGRRTATRMQWVGSAGEVALHPLLLPNAALRVSQLQLDAPATRAAVAPTPAEGSERASGPVPPYVPAPAQASTWPATWPASGGEDHTWGWVLGAQQRIDGDAADEQETGERSIEARWRYRYALPGPRLWGRLDVIGRRNVVGFGIAGLQHALQWRQQEGPWGADLNLDYWRQRPPAGLASPAESRSVLAGVHWQQQRDDRWRDRLHLDARWRDLSLRNVPASLAHTLDNDVYTRYRDQHRTQLSVGYTLGYRARYDSEWLASVYANSNPLSAFGLDNAGLGLEWRWSRHGWQASAALDARRYFADADRRRARWRERIDLDVGRWFFRADSAWRVRATGGYDFGRREPYGGISIEWLDHDGRGFDDFLPSELALRGVLETDLYAPFLPAGGDL